jgi:hypothetical protein
LHNFSVLTAGDDEAVAALLLLERAHDEDTAEEKEDQALGRRKVELLGVRASPDGICQASRGCTRRRQRRRERRRAAMRRIGCSGMTMRCARQEVHSPPYGCRLPRCGLQTLCLCDVVMAGNETEDGGIILWVQLALIWDFWTRRRFVVAATGDVL